MKMKTKIVQLRDVLSIQKENICFKISTKERAKIKFLKQEKTHLKKIKKDWRTNDKNVSFVRNRYKN